MEVLLKVVLFYASFCHNIRPRGRKGSRDEIANGVLVDYSTIQTSYPFMARLVMDAAYRCGGAVVADRYIATARHCLEACPCFDSSSSTNDWSKCSKICLVKLRENSDLEYDEETIHTIKRIHLPRNSGKYYVSGRTKTDFALVELESSVNSCTGEETRKGRCWSITPVKLPDQFMIIPPLQEVRTLGWGATEFSLANTYSEFLYQADLSVNSSYLQYALETNVGEFGTDPCEGDSGGPLLLRGDDFEWILVGTLIGGGFDCYSPQDRSDNTSDWNKVTVHMPWIQTILDRDETTVCKS